MTAKTPPRNHRTGRAWRGRGPLLVALGAVGLCLATAGDLSACPVCYGGAEGDVIEGAKLSVAFMGALVYSVMGVGVAMVVVARRRGTGDEEAEHRLTLVRGDEPDDPTEED